MPLDIVALVSVGSHPVSRRPRRADLDARALELALAIGERVKALHAGPSSQNLLPLRDYLGMGADVLIVLDCPPEADPLPALERHFGAKRPDLIVCGARAEAGECSGLLPFRIAERLGYGLACNIVELRVEGRDVRLVQAIGGGRRRSLAASLPLLVTAERTAPDPRFSAQARARRARVSVEPAGVTEPGARPGWVIRPSRPRPRRLAAPRPGAQGDAAEPGGRRELHRPDPFAAADAILDFLERDGLFGPFPPRSGDTSVEVS